MGGEKKITLLSGSRFFSGGGGGGALLLEFYCSSASAVMVGFLVSHIAKNMRFHIPSYSYSRKAFNTIKKPYKNKRKGVH